VTAAVTLRGRANGLASLLRARPSWLYVVSVPALAIVIVLMATTFGGHYLDLEVYRLGVHAWLSGRDLYGVLPVTSAGVVLPFIYPPFAALLMVPVTVSSWVFAAVAVFAASLLSLAITIYLVLRRLWPEGELSGALAGTSALLVPCLALEPVWQTFSFGQINLILMAMVTADCLMPRTRWPRGVLIGLAAAIKLTPAVFLLYLLLRRDYRAAAATVISGAVATGIGVLIAPGPSMRYWGGGLAGAGGVSGSPFFTNQTFQAVLVRAGVDGPGMKAGWLVLSVGLVLLAASAIRRGERLLAMVVTAGVGLLVSPTSWSHHWVWIAPALLVAAVTAWQAGSRLWMAVTAVLAVTFVVAPHRFLPHDNNRELSWSALQQVVGASYVIVTVVVYILLWRTWRYHVPAVGARHSTFGRQPGHRTRLGTTDTT
jgi:alpha-1,2-mannosyltransferase